MNYVVFDLEWNQSSTGQEKEVEVLPFEIIEIGAVKLDENGTVTGEFSEIIKPKVYREMHQVTERLMSIQIHELENGDDFPTVAWRFRDWCGQDAVFCTWGPLDLLELQRNMKFYNMSPLSNGPIAFLDIQKLFSIAYEDRKKRRTLEYAIDYLLIKKDIPFHRAFSDAHYTAMILNRMICCQKEVLKNISYDTYYPPSDHKNEVKMQFDTYMKYISRTFSNKSEAFMDNEVVSTKCFICRRNLRKKIRWFSVNGRHYYAVAFCEKHGYLKGKIRINKSDDGRVFVVKTTKFVSEQEVDLINQKKEHVKELRRKHRKK